MHCFAVNIENFTNLKYHILQKKLVLSIICIKCGSKDKKIFKEEESIEILKILDLIKVGLSSSKKNYFYLLQ